MQVDDLTAAIQTVRAARLALACSSTGLALAHLNASIATLKSLAAAVEVGSLPTERDRRQWEGLLLALRLELQSASILAENGSAVCREWAGQGRITPSYQPNGAVAAQPAARGQLSLEA